MSTRFLNLNLFIFTLISISSMIYIQRKSAKLEGLGIQASSVVMTIYMILLVLISICATAHMCVEYRDYDPEGDGERDLKIGIAVASFDSILNILYNFLDMVIISTYVKFSNRLMSDEVKNVASKLATDQQYHSVLNENRETVQRQKAQRRHEEYRKLADEQLKQILATMMALKTQREGASGQVSNEFFITGHRPISY